MLDKTTEKSLISSKPAISQEYETVIQLLNVYSAEAISRSERLWQQTYRFFYAILVFMLFPNISSYLEIDIPVNTPILFPVFGIILSIIFLLISLNYDRGYRKAADTYYRLVDSLPENCRHDKNKTNSSIFFRMTFVIPIILSLLLVIIGVFLIITNQAET